MSADRPLRLILLLACALTAVPSGEGWAGGDPPRLATVRVTGNASLSERDVRSALGLERGTPLTDSSLHAAAASVAALYRSRSWYGAVAGVALENVSADSAEADLSVEVREGSRAILGRLELEGAPAMPEGAVAEVFPLSPGDPLDPEALGSGVRGILSWYERAGYPFAAVSIASIEPAGAAATGEGGGDGAMVVTVKVEEGDAAGISEIRVTGNTETSEDVILRESRMDLPARYDAVAVARFAGRLRRMGIFSSVGEPTLYRVPPGAAAAGSAEEGGSVGAGGGSVSPGYGLLVAVSEGRTNTFDGVLGYAPDPGGGGSFNGSVSLGFRNLFGTARRLEAAWTRPGGTTQEIRVGYEEPWAFGLPVNLGGAFSQRRQDSTYVDNRWRIGVEFLATSSLSISALVEGQRVVPSEGTAGEAIPGSSTTAGGGVVRYDTRDDRELPTSGVDFRTEYRSGKKTLSNAGGAGSAIRNIGFDFDVFLPTASRQVLTFAVHGREVTTDAPGPADLYRLGGFRTLRGFREEQFSGVRTAWGTAEYRFLTGGGKSFFFGFLDPGYVLPGGGAEDLFTYGYGVGMRLETAIGLVGVSFALGEGDPVAQTKIHFGLINDF